ncbi:unnamed protein product [Soboliphyme baturini]|uniref:Phosphotransferase n=1 Tax=Soboliphyme baturini TaxID=241478 RepID=A0A183IJS4_9BILA|nr:unnamed protein product [Soboliphyme baturini]
MPFHQFKLESVLQEFILDNDSLQRMMYVMEKMMNYGLTGAESSIAMLPSFVPSLPEGDETGRYLAMDLGGTNLRVLLMDIKKEDSITESRNFRVPQAVMTGTGEGLFDFIVNCLANFLDEKGLLDAGLSLGFTFSYPCDQHGIRSAKLLHWTKGFNASGVVGNDVVVMLEEAIKRRGNIKVKIVALMNDTVGTQISTAHDIGQCALGVIVG